MIRRAFVVVLAITAVAVPAVAQEAVTPQAQPAEKKVCRREVAVGSIMAKAVCHTKAEWQAIREANDTAVERSDLKNRGGALRPGEN